MDDIQRQSLKKELIYSFLHFLLFGFSPFLIKSFLAFRLFSFSPFYIFRGIKERCAQRENPVRRSSIHLFTFFPFWLFTFSH